MNYLPESFLQNNKTYTKTELETAFTQQKILQSRALLFDKNKNLCFTFENVKGIMPLNECVDGEVKEIAALSRVGHNVCFIVQKLIEQGGHSIAILSRKRAQQICKSEYLQNIIIGDVINCTVTHIEPFGAFCDIGCGIIALLPIDCLSVSRISSPHDRLIVGQQLQCMVKSKDEKGRFILSLKELLGTWQENSNNFHAGETVVGIVRSVEKYGVFIELCPNLSGLSEVNTSLKVGQMVSVYIKSILPEKHKIKLSVLKAIETNDFKFPIVYHHKKALHIDNFCYT